MRDLISIIDTLLVEANLAAAEIPPNKKSNVVNPATNKPFSRVELFIHKIKTKSPFTDLEGNQIIIDPKEVNKAKEWILSGPKGIVSLNTISPGGTIKNTELLKTVEFGSKEAEKIKVKPSDIFATTKQDITDFGNNIENLLQAGGFPASEMYEKISNNKALKAMGQLGDAIIYMAKQASQGLVPVFPNNLNKDQIKAIELYASEYLGALGLVTGGVKWMRGSRDEFEDFVGSNLNDMIMFFPKATNNPLADSFSVVNDETGHAIKISSKAAGKGAPPSLASIKLPNDVRKKYPEATKFLDLIQDKSLTQFTQPFAMMNYLYKLNPNKVPKAYHSMLPFDNQLISTLENSLKTGKPVPRKIMTQFEKQLSQKVLSGSAADGGKAWYAVISDVMRTVNTDRAIPEFRAAIIESLGHNFIQLYTIVKGNQLVTEAFWPSKISGNVKLKSKGSAGELKGKMSVEISPGEDLETEPSIPQGAAIDADALDARAEKSRLVGPGVRAARAKSEPKDSDAALGRKRR